MFTRLVETKKYIKDLKKIRLNVTQNVALFKCITALRNMGQLPKFARCKKLCGEWAGYKEMSIGWDLRVIYRQQGQQLELARIGTHTQLFKKL